MKLIHVERIPITLGQFLKFAHIASSGGEAKILLSERRVTVDGNIETKRGRKLDRGSVVTVDGRDTYKLAT